MSLGGYFSTMGLIPINVIHTAVVVLEKIMVYASFAAPVYGFTDCITAEAKTPNKI